MTHLPSVLSVPSDLKTCRGVSGPKPVGWHAGVRMCVQRRCRGMTCGPRSIIKKHVERLLQFGVDLRARQFLIDLQHKVLSAKSLSNIRLL